MYAGTFKVGDRVKHGYRKIRELKDHVLQAGRHDDKVRRQGWLDAALVWRGTITGTTSNQFSNYCVTVLADDGATHTALDHVFDKE